MTNFSQLFKEKQTDTFFVFRKNPAQLPKLPPAIKLKRLTPNVPQTKPVVVENAKLKALSVITFQCSDCESNFSSLSLLQEHMKGCKKAKRPVTRKKVQQKALTAQQKAVTDLMSSLPGIRVARKNKRPEPKTIAELISKRKKPQPKVVANLLNKLPGIRVESKKLQQKTIAEKKKPQPNAVGDLLNKLPGIRVVTEKRKTIEKEKPKRAENKFVFSCSQCPQIFSTQERLDIHEKICLEPELLIKKKSKASPPNELYHFDKFKNLYICATCHEEFSFKSEIDEHIKKNHSSFKCNHCNANFATLVDLGYHSAKHNPSKSMTCPLCNYFKTIVRSKLAFHIQTQHAVSAKLIDAQHVSFACVVCTKTFYNAGKLTHHQRNYHKVSIDNEPSMGARLSKNKVKPQPSQPLLCDTCGKNFSSKYRLVRHQRAMHEGLKPYVCRFCGRAFTGKDTMQKHERIHTGERPYSCEYCGKCFRQPGPFAVHLRIHTGVRPYTCRFCKRGFITNQTKKAHMKNCFVRNVDIDETFFNDYVFDTSYA